MTKHTYVTKHISPKKEHVPFLNIHSPIGTHTRPQSPENYYTTKHSLLPCLISALLIPTLATPETGPEFARVATDVFAATTAPEVAVGGWTRKRNGDWSILVLNATGEIT